MILHPGHHIAGLPQCHKCMNLNLAHSGFFALLSCLFLLSCSDPVFDPFENEDRFYTVYGFLDVKKIDHVVRITPVTRQAAVVENLAQPEADIDAEVTSIDLDTGTIVEWAHQLERFEDGTYGHIFKGQFVVIPGCTYRLIITRSDGVTAYAETTVPVIRDTTAIEREPIRFSADSSRFDQILLLPKLAIPWSMQAIYRWEGGAIRRRVDIPYGPVTGPPAANGWNLTLNISDDQAFVRQNIRASRINGVEESSTTVLTGMGVEIQLIDELWDASEGVYDPNLFFQQPEKSNIVNGYGFFGSIGRYVQEWNTCDISPDLGYDPSSPDILGCADPDSTGTP